MRLLIKVLLSVFVIALFGCGKSNSSAAPTLVNPTKPVPSHTIVSYVVDSSLQEPGDIPNNGSISTAQGVTITIPNIVTGLSNANENSRVTVNFGTFQCYYYQTAPTLGYVFHDCVGGYTSGASLSLPTGTNINMSIQLGYVTQTTNAEITISGTAD